MVVDTSAAVAILLLEDEEAVFTNLIENDPAPKFSVASWLETTAVYCSRRLGADPKTVLRLVDVLGLQLVPVDSAQAALAISGFMRFGKGRHAARLNFGDCFSYALAASLNEPLLFKGSDFAQTDIRAAWLP